jgi:PAS domain S-box-containing protein
MKSSPLADVCTNLSSGISGVRTQSGGAVTVEKKHTNNQRRLRDALSYAESILDTLRFPILVFDRALHIMTVNQAFRETFTITDKEIEGSTMLEVARRLWNSPMLCSLLKNVHSRDQAFRDFEVAHTLPSGDNRVMLLSGRKLRPSDHGHKLMIVVIEDISERRRAEKARAAANSEMERRAADLRRSNKELEQFARVAAHDLRAPLSGVLQYNEILRERCKDKVDEEGRLYFDYITQSAHGMTLLIDDLLSYAQASRNDPVARALTDTRTVLQTAVANLRIAIAETKALITHDDLPIVSVNPTQFLQVLQNLIGNAIQYRNGLQPRIHVSTAKQNRYWLFAIKDNGIGIEPQYRDRIFEPFKRLHGSNRPGYGLGLSVCRKIVEHHGGRIWVESEIDRGSTFFFTLEC